MKNLLFAVSATIALVMASQTALANILDLTAGGDGYLNNGYFITTDQQSTGTGVIQSFVRVQANTTEDGYNASRADGVDVMPDVNQSASFTRDLQLGAIPIVTDPGNATGDYYEFLLDINQNGSNPLLSLDKVQIYTRSTSIADASTLANLTGSATLRWNMDVPGNNGVNLDYNLNSGSGSGDMFLYVPTSYFAGLGKSTYVYFYSMFGTDSSQSATTYPSNDGFEEWAVRTTAGSTLPTPPTLALLGLGLIGLGFARRRKAS